VTVAYLNRSSLNHTTMLEAERILREKGIPYRLIELMDRAMTVDDVARFSKGDIKIEEICKTVIMKDNEENRFAFFLTGTDRVDFLKAKRITGKKLSVASPKDVREVNGVDPGAVCPILLRIPLIVDENVLKLEHVNFGSGHHLHGLEMKTEDLLRAVKHSIADIAEE
jgi:Cys-tRNA(Pro)/Cys-tRNA(Cys) deacylase